MASGRAGLRGSGALGAAAALEIVTGLALLVRPQALVHLLFAAPSSSVTALACRVGGLALIALGIACWPVRDARGPSGRALVGMLTYSTLVALLLIAVGVARTWVGPLLWPAALGHLLLSALLARQRRRTLAA
jgi:hypothetical protein